MKTMLGLALCALVLTGCQTAAADAGPAAPSPSPAPTPPPAAREASATLPRYHWQLQDATDARGQRMSNLFVAGTGPVQLDFQEGRVAVGGLCNRMTGTYRLEGTNLRIGPLASTMMACTDAARTAQERDANALLGGNAFQWALGGDAAAPVLSLRRGDGRVLRFAGVPTPDTRFGTRPQTVFLEVAAKTRPCSHPLIPGKQCLQVREIQFDAQGIRMGTPGPFQNFYDPIEGYTHREGIRNVLRVKRYAVANPPADGSANAYVLDLVVESAQEP